MGDDRSSATIPIAGIPTMYAGIRFRSRLEARWADFFQRLGWEWAYEPSDLLFYIPDFVLRFDHRPLLVEVKPETELAALYPYAGKIIASGWPGEFMIVGSVLHEESSGEPLLGIIGNAHDEIASARSIRCLSCGDISVISEDYSWHCRRCGTGDGNGHIGSTDGHVSQCWQAAGNRVQWKAAV